MSRDAYADAFRRATGYPLVALPQTAGRTDSEIFFEALALNEDPTLAAHDPGDARGQDLLARYTAELAAAFAYRAAQLTAQGRALPGAGEGLAAVASLRGVIQTVLTGTIRPNAGLKLQAFGMDRFVDLEIGGYGSEVYPMGAQLLRSRGRAWEKYGEQIGPEATVYIGDSVRDVAAAATGGAHSIAVASGRSTAGELRDAGASLVLPDLTDTRALMTAVDTLTSTAPASSPAPAGPASPGGPAGPAGPAGLPQPPGS